MTTRVVVTGVGLVTPLGSGERAWSKLLESVSGIIKIPDSLFATDDLPSKIAGIVNDQEIDCNISTKDANKMDRFIKLALAASDIALRDAKWHAGLNDEQLLDTAVVLGSGIGGIRNIADTVLKMKEQGPRRVSPFFIPATLINLPAGWVSIKYGFKGPLLSGSTACATGGHEIASGARLIKSGEAKVAVVGGTEAALCPISIAGFSALRALSTKFNETPELASRPWDASRDGFVMSEGCGVLILEEYEHAKNRGAKVYAELVGYGSTADAYHITTPAPDGDGGFRAMNLALNMANVAASDVDYINAHATSTAVGDEIELLAIRRLFKDNLPSLSISSTKSATGHLLGAAGAVEAIFSILAIRDQIVPPTLNLDDAIAIDMDLVPHTARRRNVNIALTNSFGFGGTNVSLLFKKL